MRIYSLATLVLVPSALACARPAVTAVHPAPTEPVSLGVTYRLLRVGDGAGPVLAGRTDLGPRNDARVVATSAHNASTEELDLSARPAEDGGFFLRVRYEERTADSAEIRWEPELKVSRGVPARVDVSGAGWGRALEVTLD